MKSTQTTHDSFGLHSTFLVNTDVAQPYMHARQRQTAPTHACRQRQTIDSGRRDQVVYRPSNSQLGHKRDSNANSTGSSHRLGCTAHNSRAYRQQKQSRNIQMRHCHRQRANYSKRTNCLDCQVGDKSVTAKMSTKLIRFCSGECLLQ